VSRILVNNADDTAHVSLLLDRRSRSRSMTHMLDDLGRVHLQDHDHLLTNEDVSGVVARSRNGDDSGNEKRDDKEKSHMTGIRSK
jgi:hypothetical protein